MSNHELITQIKNQINDALRKGELHKFRLVTFSETRRTNRKRTYRNKIAEMKKRIT